MNQRKSLRFDKQGEPYLDKVNRLGDRCGLDSEIHRGPAEQGALERHNQSFDRRLTSDVQSRSGGRQDSQHSVFSDAERVGPREGFFDREQYEALSATLPDYLRLPLALGFFTGMRLGEILALEWDQVDFLADTINLRAGQTKNDDARTVPIVPQLRALLVNQRAESQQPECPYVCSRVNLRGHAVKIERFRKAWYTLCEAWPGQNGVRR